MFFDYSSSIFRNGGQGSQHGTGASSEYNSHDRSVVFDQLCDDLFRCRSSNAIPAHSLAGWFLGILAVSHPPDSRHDKNKPFSETMIPGTISFRLPRNSYMSEWTAENRFIRSRRCRAPAYCCSRYPGGVSMRILLFSIEQCICPCPSQIPVRP